jgi:AcrR family transcriptional regulator
MPLAIATRLAPPASTKVLNRQNRTCERILAVSARLFLERGFENTSVEDIATHAEVARSSFYRFFASREELLGGIVRPIFELGLGLMSEIDKKAPEQIIEGLLDMYLKLWQTSADGLRLSTRIGGHYFDPFRDIHHSFRSRLTDLVKRVEITGNLLNDSSDFSARLIARSVVPIMETYRADPQFEELFRRTMRGLLLKNGGTS